MDLEKLKDKAFETAKAHGWHDEEFAKTMSWYEREKERSSTY